MVRNASDVPYRSRCDLHRSDGQYGGVLWLFPNWLERGTCHRPLRFEPVVVAPLRRRDRADCETVFGRMR